MRIAAWLSLATTLLASAALAVKQEDFKLCEQSSFCRRLRAIGDKQAEAQGTFHSPYSLSAPSTTTGTKDEASWTFNVKSELYPSVSFELRVDILEQGDGIARIRMDEVGSSTPHKRYDEAANWALVNPNPALAPLSSVKITSNKGKTVISYGNGNSLEIEHSPLKITQLQNGKVEVVINERGLLHMEHFRLKQAKIEGDAEGEQKVLSTPEPDRSWFETTDADLFEEKFKKWTDSKPKGEYNRGV